MLLQRYNRLISVLDKRQPDLTVIMDNVNKAHNLAAIIRSCDAVGVLEAHAISRHERIRLQHNAASGSSKWVKLNLHSSLCQAVNGLKTSGHQIVAVHVDDKALDFRELDYTRPTALLMGEELEGLSTSAINLADQTVRIPMSGMVESLNVSVATALILFAAKTQREQAGMYEKCRINKTDYDRTLFEWAYPRLAKVLTAQNRPYPKVDELNLVETQGI